MGLSHVTMVVQDLNRTAAMLRRVLGAEEIYSSGERTFSLSREKFLLVDGVWLCIMQGEALPSRSYNHIAFEIAEEAYDGCLAAILELGLDLRPPRPRVEGEGRSIYFYDYDNHLLELHTGTLVERLKKYNQEEKR